MPCFVDGPLTDEERGWPRQKAAALCAVLGVLERDDHNSLATVLSEVDWDEAGVSREWLEAWWAEHKRMDAQRRRREADARREADVRAEAIARLTPAERRALGLSVAPPEGRRGVQ